MLPQLLHFQPDFFNFLSILLIVMKACSLQKLYIYIPTITNPDGYSED